MSGPEVTLAIAAFPAASIQTIKYIIEFARLLHEKIEQYRNAHQITADFKKYSRNLFEGEMKGYLIVAKTLFQPDSSTLPHLHEKVLTEIDTLGTLLIKANRILDENLDKDGKARKLRLSIWGGKNDFDNCAEKLEDCRARLETTIQSIDRQRTAEKKVNQLTSSVFTVGPDPKHAICLDPRRSHAELFQGTLLEHSGTKNFLALVERKIYPEDGDGSGLAEVTSQLVAALREPGPGILPCVGWRKNSSGHFELVFEIPSTLALGETLWTKMIQDEDQGYAGGHSLADRLVLARQLSGAVAFTHKRFLVHKNIRSDSVLLLRASDDPGLGHLSLINWRMVRSLKGLTVTDPNAEWDYDMYRHPKRQMPQAPDATHHFSHDIYSLGVTLLEIGMWEPLIVPVANDSDNMQVSAAFRAEAEKLGLRPNQGPGRVLEADEVQQVLISLAQHYLPTRMGPRYSDIVISCLKCVEESFAGHADFSAMENDITERYVVKGLAKIVV